MTVLIAVVVGVACLSVGFFAGVRTTARNADRLLAVMSDTEIVRVARKARLRRELLGSAHEPPKGNLVSPPPPSSTNEDG